MASEDIESGLYKLQGRVSRTIYDRVQALKDVSGQTTNSLVHQMVVHSLPHFESLYFGGRQNHQENTKTAIEGFLSDKDFIANMAKVFQSLEDENDS
jgi:hypothetical protein